MTKLIYDADIDASALDGQTVAVIGYGSQGHAHALNLSESGVNVVVGLRPDSTSASRARDAGLRVTDAGSATAEATVVMVLVPDTAAPGVYHGEIQPNLSDGTLLMFAHGFNIHFGEVDPPGGIDVGMVAPKGPGHLVRRLYEGGGGVPALFAVHRDATGTARARTLAYARGIGSSRAGVLETTFAEETETDLFGEQAVLCGGVTSLVQAGFETLVAAGYYGEEYQVASNYTGAGQLDLSTGHITAPPPTIKEETIPDSIKRTFSTADLEGGQNDTDVDIAILDTGIDLDHPDLNVYKNVSFCK